MKYWKQINFITMKANLNKEDLVHSLPDYISGRIDDQNLLREIESEIINNPEFKIELDELKSTMNFLNSAELESPDEIYFNNLPVKINERLLQEGSYWHKLGAFWKILIPAISVLIIAVILYNVSTNEPVIVATTENENNITVTAENKDAVAKNEIQTKQNNLTQVDQNAKDKNELGAENKKVYISKNLNRKKNPALTQKDIKQNEPYAYIPPGIEKASANMIANNYETAEIENPDIQEDVLYSEDSDDYNIEEEFQELTPEQQKEILEDLNNTQI